MTPAEGGAEDVTVSTAVTKRAATVAASERVVLFRGRPMVLLHTPYAHFVPLTKERFDRVAYPLLGGVTRGQVSDTFAYLGNVAEDLSGNDYLVGFGQYLDTLPVEADTDISHYAVNRPLVWDMRELQWDRSMDLNACIWRSPYPPLATPASTSEAEEPIPFVLSLAGGDKGLYDDIMQSLAPLVMERKPDGVVWWVGDGANGKSTLMDAIWRIFPGQLASINLKRLVDGRDSPSLNGTLGNIVKESSEGRIDDTEVYKNLGTHENFRVHKFHSQDDVGINGNIHTVFSANAIPSFNDKGYSARRRTFIIPFTQRFESDPEFEAKTFTPQFFSALIAELCRYAQRVKAQGYRYKWSAATLAAKLEYDTEANNAEEYAKAIIQEGVVAFTSYHPVRQDYDNWCADEGHVPLGIGNLRKALTALGFERISKRDDQGRVSNVYRLGSVDKAAGLKPLSLGRPGLFSIDGFAPAPATIPEMPVSILNGKW